MSHPNRTDEGRHYEQTETRIKAGQTHPPKRQPTTANSNDGATMRSHQVREPEVPPPSRNPRRPIMKPRISHPRSTTAAPPGLQANYPIFLISAQNLDESCTLVQSTRVEG